MRLAFGAYLEALADEASRLEYLLEANLERRLDRPNRPSLGELLAGAAAVYRCWGAQLRAGSAERVAMTPVALGPEELPAASDELLELLSAAGEGAPCWTWSEDDRHASWVARHLAHRSAIWRIDGEAAFGRPRELPLERAIDGLEERLEVDLPHRLERAPQLGLEGRCCLVTADAPAAWLATFEESTLRWRYGRGPAEAVVVADADALFRFTRGRVREERLAVTGDHALAARWRSLPG